MGNFLLNLIWFCVVGFWLSPLMFLLGLVLMCTVVGIPLGVICFRKGQQWAFPIGRNNPAAAPAVHITNIQNRSD